MKTVKHHICLRLDHDDMIKAILQAHVFKIAVKQSAVCQRVLRTTVCAVPSADDAQREAAVRLLDCQMCRLRVKVAESIDREKVALLDTYLELLVSHVTGWQPSEILYCFIERTVGSRPRRTVMCRVSALYVHIKAQRVAVGLRIEWGGLHLPCTYGWFLLKDIAAQVLFRFEQHLVGQSAEHRALCAEVRASDRFPVEVDTFPFRLHACQRNEGIVISHLPRRGKVRRHLSLNRGVGIGEWQHGLGDNVVPHHIVHA